jgi:hypothetical protein
MKPTFGILLKPPAMLAAYARCEILEPGELKVSGAANKNFRRK